MSSFFFDHTADPFYPTCHTFPYRHLEIKATFAIALWHNSHHLHMWWRITGVISKKFSSDSSLPETLYRWLL